MFFFKRRVIPDMDDLIQEKWNSRFRKSGSQRFTSETGNGYKSGYADGDFGLSLERSNLFAWSENPWYQYSDFVLEADCSFGAQNGYSAMGFCFRQLNESNYYYFLVSSRGYYRFDLVFNGSPRIIIPWTKFRQDENRDEIHIRIIARGERFLFFVEEEWVGEADDETITTGRFAWAGQNYDGKPKADFFLHRLTLESRPMEVETSFYRWSQYIPVEPAARYELAESQFLLGAYAPALIQLKRISRTRPLAYKENYLAARAFMGSGLFNEALTASERCLEEDPGASDALEISGTALYRLNRFPDLRKLLLENKDILHEQRWFWGLAGNGEYALGNWQDAMTYYNKALEYYPEEPLFQENLARAMENSGIKGKNLSFYLEAARLYFRKEEYDNVRGVLPLIRKIDEANQDADILEGKILFHEEEWDNAEALFAPIADAGITEDSSVYFLYGLILGFRKQRELSSRFLDKAADMEPEVLVYQFKAAESRHLLGSELQPYLSRALDLDSRDLWLNNLAGLDALENKRPDEALLFLEKAWEACSREETAGGEILLNYSEALFNTGRKSEALTLLAEFGGAGTENLRGNFLVAMNDFSGALDAYEKAMVLEPENRDYRLNYASACIEADYVHRAEELLRPLGEDDDPEVFNLLGNLSRLKGEFNRAEAAYRAALKTEPENPAFLLNIAELLHQRGKHREAGDALESIPETSLSARGRHLGELIKDALEIRFSCGNCSRSWISPRTIPDQGVLKIRGEIPDEAPAGECRSCGKILCVGCASGHLSEGRFICPECGDFLSIKNEYLRYILRKKLGFSRIK